MLTAVGGPHQGRRSPRWSRSASRFPGGWTFGSRPDEEAPAKRPGASRCARVLQLVANTEANAVLASRVLTLSDRLVRTIGTQAPTITPAASASAR